MIEDPGGSMHRTYRVTIAFASLLTALSVVAAGCAPDWAPHGSDSAVRYVSLGDSWVSGPLIWPQTGDPIDCGRSTRNFAALLAKRLDVKWFHDASCGGADIADLWKSSKANFDGHVAPQFTALKPDTTLVTIGIGGNDASIADSAIHCVNLLPIPLGPAPFGRPCVDELTEDGRDELGEKIEKVRSKMAAVLAEIHRRSPKALVYVLGYGKAFPEGDGCWPYAPVLPPDVHYLRSKMAQLNQVLREVTEAAGDRFVDIWSFTIGHDVCQPYGTAWINGIAIDPAGIPAHANEIYHREVAGLLERTIRADVG